MSNEKRHIFLIGPSGVGKTSVAHRVGEQCDMPVVDLDDAIAQRVGMSIHEYFSQFGEAEFREREREVIRALCIEHEPHVYATGGGSVLDTRNVIDMRNNGHVVYLSAFEADIVERLKSDGVHERPLLEGDLEAKVHEQYLVRRECYELAADITIATSRRDIDTVSEAVIRQTKRASGQSIDAASAVVVGDSILDRIADFVASYATAVIVTQESIPHQYREEIADVISAKNVRVVNVVVPEGEEAKSFSSFEAVINQMATERVTRNSVVIAVGGGVVGDLSGFVAASYHRGVDVIHVPTTLLAQVDSSLGGKCGINLASGKNLVGAFHQPKIIVADINTLNTLPDEDFRSGLGEVVKYALLGNTFVAEQIENESKRILERDPDVLVPVIRSCMNHKLHVVARDPYERNGIRATLNLGHTLAHAIETQTQYSLAHGSAVALGLRYIAELSVALGRIPESQKEKSVTLIDSLGLLDAMPDECRDATQLVDHMYKDKKSTGGLSLVLMNVGGGVELVHDVDRTVVESTLAAFIRRLSS